MNCFKSFVLRIVNIFFEMREEKNSYAYTNLFLIEFRKLMDFKLI